jgi:restriction endonuclease
MVNAAVDMFAGQEKKTSTFSIVRDDGDLFARTELGVGNALLISHDKMRKNMHEIQKRNFLPVTDLLGDQDDVAGKVTPHFSIEMETG